MFYFTTELEAICQATGELLTFAGPNIKAVSFDLAHQYCQNNGFGYLRITGILQKEIDLNSNQVINYNINDN